MDYLLNVKRLFFDLSTDKEGRTARRIFDLLVLLILNDTPVGDSSVSTLEELEFINLIRDEE